MLLFSTTTVQYELRLFDVLGNLASIQYPRFVGVVRIFVYLVAGYAVSVGAAQVGKTWRSSALAVPSSRKLLVAVVVLVIPLLTQLPQYLGHNHAPDGETLVTENELGWWQDYQDAAAWINDKPGRIAAFQDSSEHVFATLPIFTGQAVYTGGFVPAHTYRYFFEGQRKASWLPALGIKWVMSLGPWRSAPRDTELRKAFGRIRIYELPGDIEPPVSTRDGQCDARLVRFSDDQVVVRMDKVDTPCRIVIHRSDFPNWHATLDGRNMTIERASVIPESSYRPFMSVWVSAPGTLNLQWKDVPADIIGGRLATFGWAWLSILIFFSVRRASWAAVKERLSERVKPYRIGIEWMTRLALIVVLLGAVTFAWQRTAESHFTFDRHLDEAVRGVLVQGQVDDCQLAANGRGWTCGDKWDLVRSGLFSFVYDSRYCIYAHPSPRGPKVLRFSDVPLKTRLSGFYGLLDSSQGRGDVRFSVKVGDQPPVEFKTSKVGQLNGFDIVTREGAEDVEFRVEADRPAWRHFCFNAQVTGK